VLTLCKDARHPHARTHNDIYACGGKILYL
jgi:hypothetical protein